MDENQSSAVNAKNIILLILAAVATSVVITLLQVAIVGKSNVAITGGIVGAFVVGLWLNMKKKQSS